MGHPPRRPGASGRSLGSSQLSSFATWARQSHPAALRPPWSYGGCMRSGLLTGCLVASTRFVSQAVFPRTQVHRLSTQRLPDGTRRSPLSSRPCTFIFPCVDRERTPRPAAVCSSSPPLHTTGYGTTATSGHCDSESLLKSSSAGGLLALPGGSVSIWRGCRSNAQVGTSGHRSHRLVPLA